MYGVFAQCSNKYECMDSPHFQIHICICILLVVKMFGNFYDFYP